MSKHYCLSLFLSITFLVIPQAQIVLTGRVTFADCVPIQGIEIYAPDVDKTAMTDVNGYYQLTLPNDSVRWITASAFSQMITKQKAVQQKVLDFTAKKTYEEHLLGFGCVVITPVPLETSVKTLLKTNDFNQGAIDNPLQLIQGRVAGLDIQRIGGNPNEPIAMHLRGLTSVEGIRKPLIVIDNVPNSLLELLDPNDVESIEVVKDVSAGNYGFLGAAGAIVIKTKQGEKAWHGNTMQTEFKQNVSFESLAHSFKTLNASEFSAAGRPDWNRNTDWMKAITQTGIGQRYHLNISEQTDNSQTYLSGNYRKVSGILTNNDFESYGFRYNVTGTFFKKKLILHTLFASNHVERNVGFEDAFLQATIYNPTAPIRTATGAYFEEPQVDYFNPVAMVEQNWRKTVEKSLLTEVSFVYKFNNYLKISSFGNSNEKEVKGGSYFAKASPYPYSRNGIGIQQTSDLGQVFLNTHLQYERQWMRHSISTQFGWQKQLYSETHTIETRENYLQDISTMDQLEKGQFGSFYEIKSKWLTTERLYWHAKYDYNYQFMTWFNISRALDNSNYPNLMGMWTARTGFNWAIRRDKWDYNRPKINLRATLGIINSGTPNTPAEPAETKSEINIGLDFKIKAFTASMDVFYNQTQNLIYYPRGRGARQGSVGNAGIEIDLNYKVLVNSPFSWTTNLQLAATDTRFYRTNYEPLGNTGALPLGDTRLVRTIMGQQMGQIFAFQAGNLINGVLQAKDLNGDGSVNEADMVAVGQGLPLFSFNWSNQLTYKQFGLNLVGRGAIGHSLVNAYRANYEFSGTRSTYYNTIHTAKRNDAIERRMVVTDDLVEKASFFTLEHMTFNYTMNRLPCHYLWRPNYVKLLLTGHRLFTLTQYTGVTPEVRYTGGAQEHPLAPGLEMRNIYFPTRAISLGVQVGF